MNKMALPLFGQLSISFHPWARVLYMSFILFKIEISVCKCCQSAAYDRTRFRGGVFSSSSCCSSPPAPCQQRMMTRRLRQDSRWACLPIYHRVLENRDKLSLLPLMFYCYQRSFSRRKQEFSIDHWLVVWLEKSCNLYKSLYIIIMYLLTYILNKNKNLGLHIAKKILVYR